MELRLLLARLVGFDEDTKPELDMDLTPDMGEAAPPAAGPLLDERLEAAFDDSAVVVRARRESSPDIKSPKIAMDM